VEDIVAGEPEPAETFVAEPEEAAEDEPAHAKSGPGFAKLLDSLAGFAGFYGQSVKAEPTFPMPEDASAAEEPAEEPVFVDEPLAEVAESPVEEIAEVPVEEVVAEPAEEVVDEPAEQMIEEPVAEAAEEPIEEPAAEAVAEPSADVSPALEGNLQGKLTEVRAMADEARMAKLRADTALYEGLEAAYEFALDAEDCPEDYLKLVEAQGLKIQLRSPMKPVVKLAFGGLWDDGTIAKLEGVLAWALKQELPRGSLAERIDAAGGIQAVLDDAKRS